MSYTLTDRSSFRVYHNSQDLSAFEPVSPVPSIRELLASVADDAGTSASYPLPVPANPEIINVPMRLVSRLEKTRYIIAEMMKELESVRRELYLLNDRLLRIDYVVQGTLRKLPI
jgi:hypothetical protein